MPLLEDDLLDEADEGLESSHQPAAALGTSLQIELDATAEDEFTTRDERGDSPGILDYAGPGEELPRVGLPIVVEFPRSSLINPRSAFVGYEPPLPVTKERVAVEELCAVAAAQRDDGSIEFELDQFSIYTDRKQTPLELRPLHHLTTRLGHNEYLFDGILSAGDHRFYVEGVRFHEVPIGNYGIENHSVGDELWIRSVYNKTTEIYYRLKKPAFEYKRYHGPFLWVADLAKHFIDYCEALSVERGQVTLHSFRSDFGKWLHTTHGDSEAFKKWRKAYGKDDFRTAIVAYKDFLWKEYCGTVAEADVLLTLWNDIRSFDRYEAINHHGGKDIAPTIVTPYIYDCFSHMQVGKLLKKIEPSIASPIAMSASWPEHPHTFLSFIRQAVRGSSKEETIANIQPGDTISTHPDEAQTGTKWKSPGARWFGLVQKVHDLKDGERSFDITWLYRPVDTPCCSMRYPHENELFLSDHCTCLEGRKSRIHDNEVLDVHTVEWFGSPGTAAEFFVRQTYTTAERRFVTLQKSHLVCDHEEKETPYRVGDTILAPIDRRKKDVLEPCIVAEISRGNDTAVLIRLLRRRNVDPRGRKSPPNELVLSDRYTTVRAADITGRCVVRVFRDGDKIPTPYDRGGTGNLFFVTRREVFEEGEPQYVPVTSMPSRQGFDPNRVVKKLQAMDLFCGCGNFGRGLEDGGAVEYRWANDIWDRAIHTYMANAKSPDAVHPFLGSVDDMLRRGLEGKFSGSVPRPGEVDLISGGSPCPGFSLLTSDKATLRQLKNRSLVASFAAFIDFYRPKYGILENVPSIVQVKEANRNEDFFSQLICAIVGMGYQAQIIQGDAWSHGSAQQRVRAFLYFAVPGVPLPAAPPLSHSHPPNVIFRALGEMANGLPYVEREQLPTAFKYVSALEATRDLPDIQEGKVGTCIPFPDHRLCITVSSGDTPNAKGKMRKNGMSQIRNIPLKPHGLNFAQAWNNGAGIMRPEERDAFPTGVGRVQHNSKAWGRLHPHRLFSTLTTICQYQDARVGGRSLHWRQQRPITLMEARRAQGVPDDEVLVGDPSDQWRMVGNSVDRHMALALGLKLREAWLGTLHDDAEPPLPAPPPVHQRAAEAGEAEAEDRTGLAHHGGGGPYILPPTSESEQGDSGSEALDAPASPDSAAAGSTTATSVSDTAARAARGAEPSMRKRHLSRMAGASLAKRPRLASSEDDGGDPPAAPAPGASRGPTVVRLGSVDDDSDDSSDEPMW